MNLYDILSNPPVAEVAMNPAAYTQSIKTAQTAGVLVGFEFEVCVPKETIRSAADDNSNSTGYAGATRLLKTELEQTMGTDVVVFDRYHQSTKNMTSWYIEPDGSLIPNSGDAAAEVVGPPQAPNAALDSLKKFFGMADWLGLYTSAENKTGLHINVSIPQELDVLKLAVMLGDQHVLKKFGRENNTYARSIMQRLSRTDDRTQIATTVPSNIGTPYGNTATKIDLETLRELASDISGDHFSSVNFTGKYVSFRHAGGDYLSDYTSILNVVGRFVRAMVIASDAKAYRNEYLKAVTRLVAQRQPSQDRGQYIDDIKLHGLIVKTVLLYIRPSIQENPTVADFAAVLKRSNSINPIEGVNYSITTSSSAAKNIMVAKSRPEGRARREMTDPEMSPDQQFAHCVIYPTTMDEAGNERRATYSGVDMARGMRGAIVGYCAVELQQVPATDARARVFMRKLQSLQGRF